MQQETLLTGGPTTRTYAVSQPRHDSVRRCNRCLQHSEPCLLVGETGTGKTTVCQMAAALRGQRLHIINCNQHTEVSDFLGGFRPTRYGPCLCGSPPHPVLTLTPSISSTGSARRLLDGRQLRARRRQARQFHSCSHGQTASTVHWHASYIMTLSQLAQGSARRDAAL